MSTYNISNPPFLFPHIWSQRRGIASLFFPKRGVIMQVLFLKDASLLARVHFNLHLRVEPVQR